MPSKMSSSVRAAICVSILYLLSPLYSHYECHLSFVQSAVVWKLGDGTVKAYDLTGYSNVDGMLVQGGQGSIFTSVEMDPSKKIFSFTCKNVIGKRVVKQLGDNNFVYASKASGGWSHHTSRSYSALDLTTGIATLPVLDPVKVTHIVFMTLAWGLFLPLGIVQSAAFKVRMRLFLNLI